MTGLLIGTFSFFGIHTLAWLVRAVWLYLHDSKTFREAKIKTQEGDEWFTRFAPFERMLHFMVVTSFLLLVVTGMPLKFYYTGWAKFIFSVIGGPDTARMLHRFGAIVTFLYFTLHLTSLGRQGVEGQGQSAQSRDRQDRNQAALDGAVRPGLDGADAGRTAKDLIDHNKWFFGKGPKPQFDRWTYWEKFDYFAVFWGVAIIGASGLVMWFPEFFTRFLPGWAINIALILHSDEALLAAGFIFSIHFLQHAFPHREIPDGHRHFLRPRVQGRTAARTPALV